MSHHSHEPIPRQSASTPLAAPTRRSTLEVTHHEVVVPHLPAHLNGLRLVHLSDLHRGSPGSEAIIAEAVSRANALEPDITVITGDFVDHSPSDVLPVVRLAAGLRARLGVIAILGNHDYYADATLLASALDAAGITVLINRSIEAAPGLWIAGVDDLLEGRPDLEATLDAIPGGAATVLLAHHPNVLDEAAPLRDVLMLSGHTHGGQFRVGFPTPAMICRLYLQTRYVHGWYSRGGSKCYVSRGIGTAGGRLLGRRIRCRPEVALHTLRSANLVV